jgi:lipopolysaccharide cholinephosphotransferase
MTQEELRKMQLIQVDILSEFDRVCRKNNIRYIMDGGTLLGAVRHKGFIPWDDDIDVRMLRSEYEKFCEISDKELNGKVYFQTCRNEEKYPWMYSKIRMKGTKVVRLGQEKMGMRDGVFIDIFPCDGLPNDEKLHKKHNKEAWICRKILYARSGRYSANTFIERLFWWCVCVIPKSVVYKKAKMMAQRYTEHNSARVGCIGWHEPIDVIGFEKRYFTELTDLEFEGHMFMAPKDSDGFLRFSYGDDYMTPPPVEERVARSPLSDYYLGK